LQALELDKKEKNYKSLANTLLNIGKIYIHTKQYDTALIYFNKALEYQKKIDLKRGIALSYYNIASIYYQQNKLQEAEKYALKSFNIAKNISYLIRIKNAAELLTKIYADQKKWEQAYKMNKLAREMQDSIWNEKNQKATIEQQLRYKYEKQAGC